MRYLDPEIVWQPSGAFPGFEGEYRGHTGVRRFWQAFREPWERITIEPLEITEVDQRRVLVNFPFHATGRASGVETTVEFAFLTTITNGKAIHLQLFADRGSALDAAGLSE